MLQSDYSSFNPILFLECERHRNDAGEMGRHFSVVANPKLRPGTNLIKLLFHIFFNAPKESERSGNTKGSSITVLLTSCLTDLESAV
jgi:hypothetical protein